LIKHYFLAAVHPEQAVLWHTAAEVYEIRQLKAGNAAHPKGRSVCFVHLLYEIIQKMEKRKQFYITRII
jgi:hypothetical protein